MSELLEVEQRKRLIKETCLGGKITRIDVVNDEPLQGATPETLQATLANAHLTDVQRKGRNLLFVTDRDSSLLLSMNEDADVLCLPAPVTEHPTDSFVIIHFDDGHALDLRSPTLRDKFYFFPTTDPSAMEPIKTLGPEPQELTYQEFKHRLQAHDQLAIHTALTSQHYISGIGPAFTDEICFQAGIRPDRQLASLLRSEWEALYDQMQAVLKKAEEVQGDRGQLDQLGFLLPRRGTDRGCPRHEGRLEVLHFGTVRSYYCPRCQDGETKQAKKTGYW